MSSAACSIRTRWICFAFILIREQVYGKLVETDKVKEQTPHMPAEDIRSLRKNRGQGRASPLKKALISRNTESH